MTNDHAAEDVRGSFTPLICSVECVFYKESSMFQKQTMLDTVNEMEEDLCLFDCLNIFTNECVCKYVLVICTSWMIMHSINIILNHFRVKEKPDGQPDLQTNATEEES